MRRESPSSINTYMNCGYKYYLHYNKGIYFESGDAAGFGKAVHKVNEMFWPEYVTRTDPSEALQKTIDEHWRDIGIEYEEAADTCFNNFLASVQENPRLLPLYTELRCENNINNTVTIIDAVYPQKIVDYKTSTQYTIKPKIPNVIQATICVENLKTCFGLDVRHVEFQYLRFKKYQIVDVTDKMIEDVNILLSQIREKIERGEFPKNEKNCFMCEYRLICESEKRLIKKTEEKCIK